MAEAIDYLRLLREERRAARTASLPAVDEAPQQQQQQQQQQQHAPQLQTPPLHISPKASHLTLDGHIVGPISSLWYLSECYLPEEELAMVEQIEALPFLSLKTRRLQTHSSAEAPLPSFLVRIIASLAEFVPFPQPVNHVLINEYLPTQGIIHHTDGPSYEPYVAIISLLAPCVMTFRKRLVSAEIGLEEQRDEFSLVLEPRSVLVFSDSAYSHHMHGIYASDRHELGECPCVNLHLASDTATQGGFVYRTSNRISLTLRHVYQDKQTTT